MVLVLAAAGPARAFDDPSQFLAVVPGAATFGASAEGVYFTGAPRFASQTCAACHTGGAQKVGLRLSSDQPELFTRGYDPGRVYQLEVQLVDEQKGVKLDTADGACTDPPGPKDSYAYVPCNNNGFALEVDDASAAPLPSGLCATSPGAGGCPTTDGASDETVVASDGDAQVVLGNRLLDPSNPKRVLRNGATAWRFFWTAPQEGSGPLTFRVSAVDGNGGSGTAENDQDPFDDDTVSAEFFVQEAGAPVAISSSACAYGGRSLPGLFSALAFGLVGIGLTRRLRRR